MKLLAPLSPAPVLDCNRRRNMPYRHTIIYGLTSTRNLIWLSTQWRTTIIKRVQWLNNCYNRNFQLQFKKRGGRNTQSRKNTKLNQDTKDTIKETEISNSEKDNTTSSPKSKWKIGGGLQERDQLNVLRVSTENNDCFAYKIEELKRYTGPPTKLSTIYLSTIPLNG